MKWKFVCLLFMLVLPLAACSADVQNVPQLPLPPILPTAFPDSPSPAEISAPLAETPALVKIDMLDEHNGWGITEAQIIRTNDGGITWFNVTPPDIAETGFTVDVFILDNDHAWVLKPDIQKFPLGGFLYRTEDGGGTRTTSVVPFSRGDLKFLDAKDCWVLADLSVGAGSNSIAIYQTTNGGLSWKQTYANDPNGSVNLLPLAGIKSDLVPLSMTTAWVTGVVYVPGEVYFYRTDDAGQTWAQVPLTLPAGAENSELSIDRDQMKFVSAHDGFIVLRMAGDATASTLYITNDAGATWIPTSLLLDGAGSSVFLSPQEVILYNGQQFYVTRDAARTWVTVSPDLVFGESFAGMDFVNPNLGWVLTADPTTNHRSLYRTTDGGTTWLPVIP